MSVHRLRRKSPPTASPQAHEVCRILQVCEAWRVEAELASGEVVVARCPLHVGLDWLRAALDVAPVQALLLRVDGLSEPVVTDLLPGSEHASVRAPLRIRASSVAIDASEEVEISSGEASLGLEPSGDVVVRGREVTSHASQANNVRGGCVRLN